MCRLKRIVKRLPLGELCLLFPDPLMASLNVTLLYSVHSAVGLEHQSLQNYLIFYGFTWQHSLQQMFIHSKFKFLIVELYSGNLELEIGSN